MTWGDAVAYDMSADRKTITRDAENAVRRMTSAALRAGPPQEDPGRRCPPRSSTAAETARHRLSASRARAMMHARSVACAPVDARDSPRPAHSLTRHTIMEIRNLGRSGLRVSAVGLGCNNFGQRTDLETSRKVIHKAIDLGITLFDTADIYAGMGGSETVLGEVLGDRRKDIVLATKYCKPMSNDGSKQGASRRYIMSAVEASLKRLKTDYIDLYQQHDYDALTPIEETLRTLDDLVRQGKVRYIGNSNFPAWRIAEAEMAARQMGVAPFVSCQDEYSLVVRDIEKDLLPAAQHFNLGLLPFFPLANGLLTGKYKPGAEPPADSALRQGARFARPLGHAAQRGHRREARRLRAGARPHAARTRLLLARRTPAGLQRHRRRHARRADRAECEGGEWKLRAEEMAEIDGITLG